MDDEVKELIRHQSAGEESELESDIDKKTPGHNLNPVANGRTDDSFAGTRQVEYTKLPTGIWLLEKSQILNFKPLLRQGPAKYINAITNHSTIIFFLYSHKVLILILTFLCYTSYHLSRKPFSVVKVFG